MKFNTLYNHPKSRPAYHDGKGTRTQQHFEPECNINNIVARYKKTGVLGSPGTATRSPIYDDLSNVPDYQTAQGIIMKAEEAFAMLPAALRDRFGNEPVNMLRFMANPENKEEAQQLGLLKPKPMPKPDFPPENQTGPKQQYTQNKKKADRTNVDNFPAPDSDAT